MQNAIPVAKFAGRKDLQAAAASLIADSLADAISRRGHASFFGAGGSTPGPVYEQLSTAPLDWNSVTVGLTDERWVDELHPASNCALMQKTLLKNNASDARFLPMKTPDGDPFSAIDAVSDRYLEASFADVILLGMGPDAHTLSWFPGARGLGAALDPQNVYSAAAIEAQKSAVTGDNLLRMTLTLPCIANAREVILLITGEEKLAVFGAAASDSPVAIMARAAGGALRVLYAD